MAMSRCERENLFWRFGKSDDPEIEAQRQRILEVLLEASPQTQQKLIEQGFEQGNLAEARGALRRVLTLRQLAMSANDDARIEACSDLATLEGWLDKAVNEASVAEALW